MQSLEPFLIFTRKLDALGVRYMVTGSTASIYYGEPRLTNDVDIVVYLKREDAARVFRAFPEEEFYCPPQSVIEMETLREQRGHFNLIHHETGFKADIYLMGADPLHAWGMERVQTADVDGNLVRFAPPEYVIVRKLQFYREGGSPKHLRDIGRMLHSLGPEWDHGPLLDLIRSHGLDSVWAQVVATGQ